MSLRIGKPYVWKYDLYVGVWRDPNEKRLVIHPLPCVGFDVEWGPTGAEIEAAMLKQLAVNNARREAERLAKQGSA